MRSDIYSLRGLYAQAFVYSERFIPIIIQAVVLAIFTQTIQPSRAVPTPAPPSCPSSRLSQCTLTQALATVPSLPPETGSVPEARG